MCVYSHTHMYMPTCVLLLHIPVYMHTFLCYKLVCVVYNILMLSVDTETYFQRLSDIGKLVTKIENRKYACV